MSASYHWQQAAVLAPCQLSLKPLAVAHVTKSHLPSFLAKPEQHLLPVLSPYVKPSSKLGYLLTCCTAAFYRNTWLCVKNREQMVEGWRISTLFQTIVTLLCFKCCIRHWLEMSYSHGMIWCHRVICVYLCVAVGCLLYCDVSISHFVYTLDSRCHTAWFPQWCQVLPANWLQLRKYI